MNFNVNIEGKKVAKILDRSPNLRRLLWGAMLSVPLTALVWKAADILNAVAGLLK